jgi:hypothetical protein
MTTSADQVVTLWLPRPGDPAYAETDGRKPVEVLVNDQVMVVSQQEVAPTLWYPRFEEWLDDDPV